MYYIKKHFFYTGIVFLILFSCKREPELTNYGIRLKVEGSGINQIYFRSVQRNFDVANIPTKEWAVDTRLNGNDTIVLYGKQATDTIPITVSIRVEYPTTTITYTQSDPTECQVKIFLPK